MKLGVINHNGRQTAEDFRSSAGNPTFIDKDFNAAIDCVDSTTSKILYNFKPLSKNHSV